MQRAREILTMSLTPAILSHDLRSEQERVGDMEDDSDSAGVSRQPNTLIPWSRQTIPDARRPLGDVTGYEELNQAMLDELWSYFLPKVTSISLACLCRAR